MRYEWSEDAIWVIWRWWRRLALSSSRAVVRDEGWSHSAEELRVQARDEAGKHGGAAGDEDRGDERFAKVNGDLGWS